MPPLLPLPLLPPPENIPAFGGFSTALRVDISPRMSRPHNMGSIRIGVSSCLLGEQVRYDGGHKRNAYVTGVLAAFFELLPVCPETECGMGVPREALRLVRDRDELQLVAARSGRNHSAAMKRWSKRRLRELEATGLSGFILKKGSPSCGMERVRVYTAAGRPAPSGSGLFAAALVQANPGLPVEEEERLEDPALRDNFIERVFAFARLRDLLGGRWRIGDLVDFHSREEMLLLAHDAEAPGLLAEVLAAAGQNGRLQTASAYRAAFMSVLAKRAAKRRQARVFEHMLGYLRGFLGTREKSELTATISDFRRSQVPLIGLITLFRHYARLHRVEYLERQSYLQPDPREVALRNRV